MGGGAFVWFFLGKRRGDEVFLGGTKKKTKRVIERHWRFEESKQKRKKKDGLVIFLVVLVGEDHL